MLRVVTHEKLFIAQLNFVAFLSAVRAMEKLRRSYTAPYAHLHKILQSMWKRQNSYSTIVNFKVFC